MSAKISALGSLTGAGVAQTADMVPIVDTSVTTTKSILISELSLAQNVFTGEQAMSGLSSKSFDVPSWATRMSIMMSGVSTNGTDGITVTPISQYQDGAGGTECRGSVATQAGVVTSYDPFTNSKCLVTASSLATSVWEIIAELTFLNSNTESWKIKSIAATSNAAIAIHRASGTASQDGLISPVISLVVSTVNGTDLFDAGSVNVMFS